MFQKRFAGVNVEGRSITELRGMEGFAAVRAKYAELGQE